MEKYTYFFQILISYTCTSIKDFHIDLNQYCDDSFMHNIINNGDERRKYICLRIYNPSTAETAGSNIRNFPGKINIFTLKTPYNLVNFITNKMLNNKLLFFLFEIILFSTRKQ